MTTLLPPIFCLMGPTSSGKTALAVKLVQDFPFEIISVDSAMVYRGLDIGTAKPSPAVLRLAPHRLIDICNPDKPYSAAQFRQDAQHEIKDIHQHGKIPLLVGGTMMYFRTLHAGIASMPSADTRVRATLSQEGRELGWPALHQRLLEVDPIAAARIHPHDSQRIQRALEVYGLTGRNVTAWYREQIPDREDYKAYHLVVAPENRAILHARIARRFMQMLENGLIEEVKVLLKNEDFSLEMPAVRAVGYRQVSEYLQGKVPFSEMREKGIIATRQLAKRQLTWLRRWEDAVWFDSEAEDLYSRVANFIHSTFLKIAGPI